MIPKKNTSISNMKLSKSTAILSKTKNKINNSNNLKNCVFCEKCPHSNDLISMIKRALYVKFSSSQNYYYSKDITELISQNRCKMLIKFKDQNTFDEEEDYLKRLYSLTEYKNKIKILTEYYKYHREIPRIFAFSISKIMNNYHDKKRKIEYIRIKHMIKENNGEVYDEKKEKKNGLNEGILIEEKNEKTLMNKNFIKILDKVDLSEKKIKIQEIPPKNIQNMQIIVKTENNEFNNNSLLEIKNILNEIINEKTNQDESLTSFGNESQTGNLNNLTNFLKFMKKKSNLNSLKDLIEEQKKTIENKPYDINIRKSASLDKEKKLFIEQNKFSIHKNIDNHFKNNILFKKNFTKKINIKLSENSTSRQSKHIDSFIRKSTFNRKSMDANIFTNKNSLPQKNNEILKTSKNYVKTETSADKKYSHLRIQSTIENTLKYDINKKEILNKHSKNNKSINNESKNSGKSSSSKKNKKNNMKYNFDDKKMHKYTKSVVNGDFYNQRLLSPNSNKDLKLAYRTKNKNISSINTDYLKNLNKIILENDLKSAGLNEKMKSSLIEKFKRN